MPNRSSTRIVGYHWEAFLCVRYLSPFCFHARIFATWADANSGTPGVPVQRWVLGIFPRARFAPRATKFLRSRCALLTFPPSRVRLELYIGCDHAAQTRKEITCQTQRNPRRKSASTRYPQRYGGTKTRRASSTPSHLNAVSRTTPANGRPLRASMRATSCLLRRLQIRPTVRFTSCAPTTATANTLTKRPPKKSGQGALTGALPLLYFPCSQRTQSEGPVTYGVLSTSYVPRHDGIRRCYPIREIRRKAEHASHRVHPILTQLIHQSGSWTLACGSHLASDEQPTPWRLAIFSWPNPFFPTARARARGSCVRSVNGGVVSQYGQRPLHQSAAGLILRRNANSVARRLILRFSRRMVVAINAVSKLSADNPQHAQFSRLIADCLRSTWQGGGDPLRCILPQCRGRHAETLPVSTPSGMIMRPLYRAWWVCA